MNNEGRFIYGKRWPMWAMEAFWKTNFMVGMYRVIGAESVIFFRKNDLRRMPD